jgi:hypothetical protein
MSPDQGARQRATVNRILEAFFDDETRRREVQLLADEVGMGKTFVALGAAYATLAAMNSAGGRESLGLKPAYRAVLVITPGGNHALAEKWRSEAEALITRCSRDPEKTSWFKAKLCLTADELFESILLADDQRRKKPVLIIAHAGIFNSRLSAAAERFLIASLFRWWGNALPNRDRFFAMRALAATPGSADWTDYAVRLGRGEYDVQPWDWSAHERYLDASDEDRGHWNKVERESFSKVSTRYVEIKVALDRFAREEGSEELESIRGMCLDGLIASEPGDRRTIDYREWYKHISALKSKIRDLHKRLWRYLLNKKLPLVISDEAHHFRHARRQDCTAFRMMVAPLTQRLLMLTATPLQLAPEELLCVLQISDAMQSSIGGERVKRLEEARQEINTAMQHALAAGRRFAAQWGSLAEQLARIDNPVVDFLSEADRVNGAEDPRTEKLALDWQTVSQASNGNRQPILDGIAGPIRAFFACALELRDSNRQLQKYLAPLVIRHRREYGHRRYWVGREYPPAADVMPRPDQSRLHLAAGAPLPADAEMAQYLLMRVVADIAQGTHRTALGADLTGSYTTLWASEEGRRTLTKNLSEETGPILKLLRRVADGRSDHRHPKLRLVAEEILRRWLDGEKSLVFCSRVPTAHALHQLISRLVAKRLDHARRSLLETRERKTREPIQAFRRSLTARDSSVVNLFLDRVLFDWLESREISIPELRDEDLADIAALCARARHGSKQLFATFARPDRVFLHRAIEHVLAKRLINGRVSSDDVLQQIADEAWVKWRYGVTALRLDDDTNEAADYRARTSSSAAFELSPTCDLALKVKLLDSIRQRRARKANVIDLLITGPNLLMPPLSTVDELGAAYCRRMRVALRLISRTAHGCDWALRAQALDATVRAFLREDMLLRLPANVFTGEEDTWAEKLVRGLHESGQQQREPIAARLVHFLEELCGMGKQERDDHLRYVIRAQTSSVELCTGDTKNRGALFTAFNTPLLPDVLICTAVGGEGIDLHRQCRHIVHYDLDWNPANVEQRTGRVDRIGSKAERERTLALRSETDSRALPGLDIALPYLAGTYDERVFDVLRARSQMFEILMGGDVTADADTSLGVLDSAEGPSRFVPLPHRMLQDLRVDLSVWQRSSD